MCGGLQATQTQYRSFVYVDDNVYRVSDYILQLRKREDAMIPEGCGLINSFLFSHLLFGAFHFFPPLLEDLAGVRV